MRSIFIISLLGLAASIAAQDVDANDLPSQCKDVCAPVVSLTASCDKNTHDDDTAEMKCVCNDSGASKSIPNCAACLDKYSKDGKDNDANDLVSKCSFTSTTYAAASSASASSNSSASMTSPSLTSGTGATSVISGSETVSATGTSTSSNAAASTSGNSAGKSIERTTGLLGTVLGLMALVAL